MANTPLTLQELKKLRTPVANANVLARAKLKPLDRLALWITDHVGTMGFFGLIFLWTVFWLSWNVFAPKPLQFDPFPAFVLWLFISNMIQIFLMPLLMIGQNLQGKHSEARAEADFDVNVRAEREVEAILMHLENQNDLISKILTTLDKRS